MKIGFFDSGLGGLTILKAVAKELPEYDYEFYGDTANLPYGNKTEEEVFELTQKGVEHLFERDCLIVILACNTASAETLRRLQDGFLKEKYSNRRILGVVIPTIEEVLESGLKKVLLIGTKRTIESGKYFMEMEKIGGQHAPDLVSVATPALVPLIELGDFDVAVKEVLATLKEVGEREAVILGCTHYSVLEPLLKNEAPFANIKIFSQDKIIPNKLRTYLDNHPELKNKLSREGKRNIFLTDLSSRYDAIIQELLGGSYLPHED
jgi:glutamate racemase